jgi:small conductance mechanosensitive channel
MDFSSFFSVFSWWSMLPKIQDGLQVLSLRLLWALVACVVWWKIIRLTLFIARKWFERLPLDISIKKFTLSTLRIVLWVLLLIAVARTIGVETTSLVALVGAAWLAIGLALQWSLQNVAGGVLIMIIKPFLVGESIEINTMSGTVDAITLFNTTLITPDKKTITIPNSLLANGTVINVSRLPIRRIDILLTVSYGTDQEHIKNVLTHTVQAHPQVLSDPEPQIHINLLGDQWVQWIVRPYVRHTVYLQTYYELNELIYQALLEHTITTPALEKLQKESRLK